MSKSLSCAVAQRALVNPSDGAAAAGTSGPGKCLDPAAHRHCLDPLVRMMLAIFPNQ